MPWVLNAFGEKQAAEILVEENEGMPVEATIARKQSGMKHDVGREIELHSQLLPPQENTPHAFR